tara:strand:+ start:344 stop:610 length:267 start_codon:yes stop_codon:yes gene_type:complete
MIPGTKRIGFPISVDLPTASSIAFKPGMDLRKGNLSVNFVNLISYNMIKMTERVKTNIADFSSLKKLMEDGSNVNSIVNPMIIKIPRI